LSLIPAHAKLVDENRRSSIVKSDLIVRQLRRRVRGRSIQSHNQTQEEEFDQKYLDRYDLVIGMNGKPMKKFLVQFEK
jgi:hypothetical protein